MKKSRMSDYMRQEMWVDRIEQTISNWEKLQNVAVPEDTKDSIINFLRRKIGKGIKQGTLIRTFMQIAVSSLLYIKMRGLDK